MSDKGIFDDAIYILGRYMDNRLRGKDASIRVLEAAGRVNKKEALELINDVPRDERLYGEGFTGSGEYPARKQLRSLLEALPDGGKK